MSEFEKKERYVVIKLSKLNQSQKDKLSHFLVNSEIDLVDCVVVESDWANYDDTWKAIEQVSNGEYKPLQRP